MFGSPWLAGSSHVARRRLPYRRNPHFPGAAMNHQHDDPHCQCPRTADFDSDGPAATGRRDFLRTAGLLGAGATALASGATVFGPAATAAAASAAPAGADAANH